MNRIVGESAVRVRYCGHSAWGEYRKANGDTARPGGALTYREEWVDRQGEVQHRISEMRVEGDVDPVAALDPLTSLQCGAWIELSVVHYRSPRGTTWDNVRAVRVLDPAGL